MPKQIIRPLSEIVLVYEAEDGSRHEQYPEELVESGTLIDPDTGEDMALIGYSHRVPA